MNVKKRASRRSLKSDLARVDTQIKPKEYKELPELTDEMLARARAGQRRRVTAFAKPSQTVSLRLPTDVIERWKATGPGLANAHGGTFEQGAVTKP